MRDERGTIALNPGFELALLRAMVQAMDAMPVSNEEQRALVTEVEKKRAVEYKSSSEVVTGRTVELGEAELGQFPGASRFAKVSYDTFVPKTGEEGSQASLKVLVADDRFPSDQTPGRNPPEAGDLTHIAHDSGGFWETDGAITEILKRAVKAVPSMQSRYTIGSGGRLIDRDLKFDKPGWYDLRCASNPSSHWLSMSFNDADRPQIREELEKRIQELSDGIERNEGNTRAAGAHHRFGSLQMRSGGGRF